ncbi:MAG: hypothetical protein WEA04_02195 [Candidatus Andersenbacteria bacterium]
MSTPSGVFAVDSSASQARLKSLQLLVALIQLSKSVKHCWGPMEEELRKGSGLSDEDFNHALSDLLNCDKCVRHRYSQEGTAGPFAHRYEVMKNLTFSVTWGEEK